jgi:predicted TIM-barrel fold metal-dependent hydrolase
MLPSDAQVISVDDHVIEHPTVWQDRLPAKHREAGPRVITTEGRSVDPLGNEHVGRQQLWQYEGRSYPTIGLNAVAGKSKEEFGIEPISFDDMIPGCWDVQARVKDMDADGIQAQLNFPSFPGFAGRTFYEATDKELAYECVKAWNDFMLDEWCGYAPDRFIPLVITPYWDPSLAATEIRRTAAKGAKAVTFVETPHTSGLPSLHSDHWDPLLAAAQEADMPICMHFGSGGAPAVAPDANFAVAIALFGTNSEFALVDLLLSPVFHKFPRLQVALSEGGIGWMPWMLERTDYVWDRHRHYTGCNPDVRPSDLFREHITGCFIADEAGVEMRHLIGVDNIAFESDYPHSDSNWPNSRTKLEEALADVPDDEARKIAELNARRVFRFPR